MPLARAGCWADPVPIKRNNNERSCLPYQLIAMDYDNLSIKETTIVG